mmetsp:Transcript_3939/g.7577  ORF Transcript_3939/g.7577 Transcript_3939/m.7577 type:complete len:604 (+) Transcript_3939:92-1903(+)
MSSNNNNNNNSNNNNSSNGSSSDSQLVAVGVDIGSHNARIYISQNSTSYPSIVPNENGQRYTLAISVAEPEIESDPMNDQYWDDNKKQTKDSSSSASKKKKDVHYLHGDAARKSLQRLKKPIEPHCILNMIKTLQQEQQNHHQEEQGGDEEQDQDLIQQDDTSNQDACLSFFQHLTNLTAHASHTSPQHLRFVLSVPPSDTSFASELSVYFQQGVLQSIQQAGYAKSEKKMIHSQKRILSLIAHPVAIAHAHGLLSDNESGKKNVLIVDWGASAMSMTHLVIVGGIARIQKHVWEPSLSGRNIIALVVKHIAELFERKNRGIPPGEVMCNKKARAKLEIAAEEALRSLGFSSKVTVNIDGLYEGLDCHADVMLATFEMLMRSFLTKAEGLWKGFQEEEEEEEGNNNIIKYDAVIGAGSVMNIKCVERLMDRIFPCDTFHRGKSANDVPPEEAIAMGCAIYGSCYLSTTFLDAIHDNSNDESNGNGNIPDTLQHLSLVEEEVALCPMSIGLRLVEGDPIAILLIEEGAPLPALVTKMINVSECSSKGIDIVQITSEDEKTIGKIQGIDGGEENKQIEITAEVDESGIFSVAVNGLVTEWEDMDS